MVSGKKYVFPVLCFALFLLLFTACGSKAEPVPTPVPTPSPVVLPDGGEMPPSSIYLDLTGITHDRINETKEVLKEFPKLIAAKLGAVSADDFAALFRSYPDIIWSYSFDFRNQTRDLRETELDLTGITDEEAAFLLKILPAMKDLKTVHLGSEAAAPTDWNIITSLAKAAPWAAYDYNFTIYGVNCNLSDAKLDLWQIPVEDNCAEVYKVLPAMTKCTYVDMDSCGVESEVMAELRDAFPEKNVVWRVNFSWSYTVRTDTEKILCSLTGDWWGDLGLTNEASVEPLKYCTKVKYLDLGHNNKMETISFTAYMPDLEVLIIYKDKVKDISPLANCKKLRYLELCKTPCEDLSPLAGLTELTDLEIGDCPNITDITCLYDLPNLQRLWIGNITPVPQEQIDKFCELHPNCIVNTTDNEIDNTWRYYCIDYVSGSVYWPRYQEIREIFNYGENAQGQSMWQFDPYVNRKRDY